ncbi:MAG: SBBP repeat-containing protein, partial [Saprospiraceae bacterium]|nr:SBBP repeat-containing protein [Saprospiraceae bacterium]
GMRDIWEGITVELRANNHIVETLFYVSPHTDPQMIQMDLEGAESLSVSNDGQLIVHTSSGELAYSAPIAYQWIEGKKHGVEVAYQIDKDLKTRYTFQVSNYNPAHELIIDPFLASTFIGAGRNDWSNAITIGPDEHVFITGYTWTDTFPTLVGSYDEAFSGVKDAYVAKLSNDLSTLVAATFLGGGSWEGGLSIWAEDSGNVIVSGATGSADFPTTSNAYDNTYNGGTNDVFVCKLNNNLSQLLVSTFIGGDDDDYGYDLTQDQAGNIFLCGVTESANFPSFHGFDQSFNGGFEDVFVCKLNNGLTNLLASTYLGGSTDESADAVIADQAGNIFIAGFTYSPDFPIAGVVYDSTHNGSGDIFISKLGNNLDTLIASTFIGGTNFEESHAIALDSLQNIFIAGYTGSFEYPSTPGVFDPSFNNNHDAIITKIDNNLTNILASTFIGGTGADDAYGLVVQGTQNVFITGVTFSNDYPTTTNASDDTYNGRRDILLSRLSFDLSEL